MKGQKVVHSSSNTGGSDEWTTPEWLYDYFYKDYKFGLDAAASDSNFLCLNYFTEQDDALKQSWKGYGNVFVNPPYSKNQQFLEKIIDELDGTFSVIALVPSRTDTRWWHDLVMPCASEIWFIKGRLKFSNSQNSAPFPSCVLRFKYSEPNKDYLPKIYSLAKPKSYGRHKPVR